MIRLFKKEETQFDHNETVLSPFLCDVGEQSNGAFELEIETALDKRIDHGTIISSPTPRGEQLFRLYRVTHTLRKTKAVGRHIFYDLLYNFIEDTRPTTTTGSGALNAILGGTLYPHRFTGKSDLTTVSTAYYVRKNPVQALLGLDNCLVSNWGGFIKRDNYTIYHIADGDDNGYEIRYGRNLTGLQRTIDDTEVITKIMPTWVVDNVVKYLPEKYIDSPLIGKYPQPRVAEIRIDVPEKETDPVSYVRKEAVKYFSVAHKDEPVINYKIDFCAIRHEGMPWLSKLDLYDVVYVYVPELDINVRANVISYKYNAIKERFEQIEIGNFTKTLSGNTGAIVRQIEQKIDIKVDELAAKQKEATDKIAGVKGGNVVLRLTAEGKPYEILVMDTADMATAKNVIRLNQNGMGFSQRGINGPYSVAITIDGHIVADFVNTGVLTANLVKAGVLSDKTGKISINMETGAINFDGDLQYDPVSRKLIIAGSADINAATIRSGTLDSARIGNLSADKLTGGTINADYINVKNINADNLTRGTVGVSVDNRSGKFSAYRNSATVRGSSTDFLADNSGLVVDYLSDGRARLTIKGNLDCDTLGGRHTFEANGISIGSGTAYMKVYSNYTKLYASNGFDCNELDVASLKIQGRRIVLNTDNKGIHYE